MFGDVGLRVHCVRDMTCYLQTYKHLYCSQVDERGKDEKDGPDSEVKGKAAGEKPGNGGNYSPTAGASG